MSRIGNNPIPVPPGVDVKIAGSDVSVKGPKGSLQRSFNSAMKISKEDGFLKVERPSDEREHKALHGLTRSLLANMVTGVSDGFVRTLDLVGVGYRTQQNGPGIRLNVMFSHSVDINPPDGVEIEAEAVNQDGDTLIKGHAAAAPRA